MPKVMCVSDVVEEPQTFDDVKGWYDDNLHPSVVDFDDPKPYEVYEKARWGGIFQCVDEETSVAMADGTQKCIGQIEVDDEVMTYDEASRQFVASSVERIYDQGMNDCIELEFDDGRKLICTMDHPVLTRRGWIIAGELGCDDEIECFGALL